MKAILINPYDRSVREVQTEGGGRAIAAMLSVPQHTVSLFTVVGIDDRDSIFLDDEGLLQPGRVCWRLKHYPSPLAGCGLVLGCDDEGDSIAPVLTVEDVAAMVEWTDQETTGDLTPGRDGTVVGPDGKDWPAYIGGSAILQPQGTHAAAEAADKATQRRDSQ